MLDDVILMEIARFYIIACVITLIYGGRFMPCHIFASKYSDAKMQKQQNYFGTFRSYLLCLFTLLYFDFFANLCFSFFTLWCFRFFRFVMYSLFLRLCVLVKYAYINCINILGGVNNSDWVWACKSGTRKCESTKRR